MAETSEGFRSVERPKTRERGSTDNVELTDIEENMAENASIEQGTVGQGQGRVGGRKSSRDCSKHEPAASSQDGAYIDVIEEHAPKMPSDQIDLAGDQSNLDASEVERPIVHFPQTDEVEGSGISEEPITEVVSSNDHQTPDTNRADDTTSATNADDNETTTTSQPTEVADFSDAIYGDDMDYGCQTFNADDFSKKLAQLTDHFTTPALRGDIELSYPIPALQKLIKNAINCALVYKTYSMACKKSLTFLREQMRAVRNSIHTQVQMRHKQIMAVDPFLDLEEKELRAEASKLHAEVAKISAELAQALKFSTETETTATEAAEAAIKAAQEANRIQQELEAKRLAEEKETKLKYREKELELEKLREQKRRAEEEKKRLEKERKQRQKMSGKIPMWETWTPHIVHIEPDLFDIGCIIRAKPGSVDLNGVTCHVVQQTTENFKYGDHEELVSNLIHLKLAGVEDDGHKLQRTVFVALPHFMTRASALSRETVIKADYDGEWRELPTQEVTSDHNKEMKFAQAGIDRLTTLAVVSRLKRDYHVIPKKASRIISSVDQRITFTCDKMTFSLPENFMLQIQPVDHNSLAEVKKRYPECSGLLNTSSIVKIQWEGKSKLCQPIVVTVPIPPNPVKARKAAEMKKLKEDKLKKPAVVVYAEPPAEKKTTNKQTPKRVQIVEEEEDLTPAKPPTKWYMGQYATNDDDENDNLYLVTHDEKGHCQIVPGVTVNELKIDVVQFTLNETLPHFTIVRTKTNIDDVTARQFAVNIESYLSQKLTKFVVKQKGEEPNSVVVECVMLSKVDKTVERLEEEGYDDGPEVSQDLSLQEGDVIEVMFKGNVKNEVDNQLMFTFNSQLQSGIDFWAIEANQYLQRSYPVFRGMVQMYRRTETVKVVLPDPEAVMLQQQRNVLMANERRISSKTEAIDVEKGDVTKNGEADDAFLAVDEEPEISLEPQYITEVSREFLCQLMLSIPKDHVETIQPVVKAPVLLLSNIRDPVDDEYLRHLAEVLGEEWKKLAHYLGLRRVRVQAILCNTNKSTGQRRTDEEARYEMLTTWMKRVPRGCNKVSVLRKCLNRIGRRDLVEEIIDLEKDFVVEKKKRLTRRPSKEPPMLTPRDSRTSLIFVS